MEMERVYNSSFVSHFDTTPLYSNYWKSIKNVLLCSKPTSLGIILKISSCFLGLIINSNFDTTKSKIMSGHIQKVMETVSKLNDQNEIMELIHSLESRLEEKATKNTRTNSSGIELTLKQKVLLLWTLKILDTPSIKHLSAVKKATLLSNLLGCGEKSVKDLLTYIDIKEAPVEFLIFKEDNVKRVNELLESLGLQEYLIKEN